MSPRNIKFVPPPPPHLLLSFSDATSSTLIPPSSIPSSIYNATLHPAVPFTIAAVYAATVHYFNSLSNGTPYKITKTRFFHWGVVLHNLLLAVYSAWTFIGMIGAVSRSFVLTNGVSGFVDSLCKIQDQTNLDGQLFRKGLWGNGLDYYGWIFYLSKFYEVVDTMIILAKGKKSSTLQTYHHSGAMISMWAGIRWMSPPIWLFCVFNSLIHTLMYTYYTLSTLRIRVPGILKRSLTSLQITQFIIGGSSAALYLFIEYRMSGSSDGKFTKCLSNRAEEWAVVINCLYLAPLTYLFVRFFIRSYLGGASAGKRSAQHKAGAKGSAVAVASTNGYAVNGEVLNRKGYVNGGVQLTGEGQESGYSNGSARAC